MSTLYTVGGKAVVTIKVRNESGALTDPTTLDVVATPRLGAPVSFSWAGATITRVSQGVFRFELTITEAGTWRLVATTTGAVTPATKSHALYARAA